MREGLSQRFFKFTVNIICLSRRMSTDRSAADVLRQLMRSATSIGADWEEAVAGLSKSDFTHSANIARKEAREAHYWLRVAAESFPISRKEGIDLLIKECDEIISIPTAVVKKQQTAAVKTMFAVLLFSSLIPHLSSFLFAADWPMFRGDEQRTGFAREQAYPPLTKAWEFQMGGDMLSSPVVCGDIVYIGSQAGGIYALNARTGAAVWQYQTGGRIAAAPAVSGGIVYVPSVDGWLYALDRLTGDPVWRAGLGASSISSPLVSGGRVFLGAGLPEKKLKAFDAATGALLFEYQASQPVDGAPAAYGNAVYFGSNDGRIYALNGDSGSPLWPSPGYYQTVGSFGANAVAVSSGAVYALPGRDEKKVFMLDALTGAQLNVSAPIEASDSWELAASPVAAGDRIYFAAGASGVSLYALDSLTLAPPSPAWPGPPSLGSISGFGTLSSPAMANEIIYAATADGRLVSVSSSGASASPDVDISSPAWSSPAVSNGMVFVAMSGGKLLAYKADKTTAISSPKKGEILSGDVVVKGYVSKSGRAGYDLEYRREDEPGAWTRISSAAISEDVENGALGVWNSSGLANGLYSLRLTALEDPVSGADNTALVTARLNAAPLPPTGLAAADLPGDSGNRIRLDWTASVTAGVAAYRIYRDAGDGFGLLASTGASAAGYIDASAVTGATFTYTVRAFDGYVESGNSNSASVCSINDTGDGVPPAGINDLAASPGSAGGTAALVWTAPGNDGNIGAASHYLLRYTTAADYDWNNFDGPSLSGGTRAVEGPAGAREADEIGGLLYGVTYYFAVRASDFASNLGALSNIAASRAAPDPVPPLPPSDLGAADVPADGGGSLALAWTLSPDDGALANDVYGYKIYRRVQDSAYISSAPYAVLPKGTAKYADNSAPENVRFYYSVAAFDSTNDSAHSNEAWGVSADNWRFLDASQGGAVRLADGTEIAIPGGAASQNDGLMVVKLDPLTYRPLFRAKADTRANPTGITYEIKFRNPGTRLVKPARLSLPYTDAAVAGMDRENLKIYTLNSGVWLALNTSKADPGLKKVTAEAMHFSTFTIMEYIPSGALLSEDSVYTYPNPATGDSLTFKFYLADKAYVTVDVYNVAGEKAARLEKAGCPAGATSEIIWPIKNIAGGVYQYKVEARSASGSKSVMKRLAVIH